MISLQRVPDGGREQDRIKVKRASEYCTETRVKAARVSPLIVKGIIIPNETYMVTYR